MVAETGRDFGTTLRHDWAIFQCQWQARFDAHLNRLQGHRRQPIARSGKFVRRASSRRALDCACAFSHRALWRRQRCWKRGSGGGQRLSLYDYGTTERSFNVVERWGSTLTCTVCTAAYREDVLICGDRSIVKKTTGLLVCMLFLYGGLGKRGGLTWLPAVKNQRPAAKTTNSNCSDRTAAQVKQHIPEQPGWRNSQWWTNKEKGIKLILKTIGNRKGDCAWSSSRWHTQPEKIWKLRSTSQYYNMRSEWHWFVRFDLQILSGCVCHLEQLHAQSPFLFPLVFSISWLLSLMNSAFKICAEDHIKCKHVRRFCKSIGIVVFKIDLTNFDVLFCQWLLFCLLPG